FFFFQAEDGIRDFHVTGVQTCALPILRFTDANGSTLLEQDRGHTDISGRLRTLPFGRSTAGGAHVAFHESFAAPSDEVFAGFGEIGRASCRERGEMWGRAVRLQRNDIR